MDFPQRSHRPMTHYILEFAAVLLGISASLYAENVQELQRNERIKNQSLTRIQRNIEQDIADTDFNIQLHQTGHTSCKWVLDRQSSLTSVHPDSLGKHCGICLQAQTLFVDNQEEYRALQNSGLIELIRSDSLVQALQTKYAKHEFIKNFETTFNERANRELPALYGHFVTQPGAGRFMDFVVMRTWDGMPLEGSFFELVQDIVVFRELFIPIMEERKAADEQLIRWISAEVGEG
ncbi:MAG TPA: hypothetical protein DEP62_03070 [Flavobacteriales bacterium]|nr:hypothetical protein [Flavobacteriales bacterium]|tara:strand:+ start:270 stop:974 length:705 start_codon:yes stop_codon:yes gene_type:complete